MEELQRLPYNVIGFSEDMHRRNRQLKDFLYTNLYRHYRVVRMAVKAERIIRDLFNAYLQEPADLARARPGSDRRMRPGAHHLRLYCRDDRPFCGG